MSEQWVDCSDNNYEINRSGQVRNKRTQRILKNSVGSQGYYVVCFCSNNTRKQEAVHSILAKAFLPNPANLPVVDHIDCDKLNISLDNLEWVTYKENTVRAISTGLIGKNSKPVDQFKDGVFVATHVSIAAAARAIGLCNPSNGGASLIKACCDGKQHRSKDYTFSYAKEVVYN